MYFGSSVTEVKELLQAALHCADGIKPTLKPDECEVRHTKTWQSKLATDESLFREK